MKGIELKAAFELLTKKVLVNDSEIFYRVI